MTVLTVSALRMRYGALEALHGVSLAAREGITAVIGSNGAGKTSLMRTISGLLKSSGGRVELDGERIDRLPPHKIVRRGLVQVPEGRELFPQMTVLETLEIGATTLPPSALPARRDEVLELFPVLRERAKQRVGTLSGGEQQMAAIGRALMAKPRVLLLDEPSLGLAPVMVDRIADTIRQLADEGLAIVLVEQNARMALELANQAYVLVSGTVGLEGSGADLLGDPDVVERYLGGRATATEILEGADDARAAN